MKRNSKGFLLLVSMAFVQLGLFAQSDKDAKTLLWEISGKDLPGPSYLYGTMHTTDKRAFKFKKSVMPSFENCKAFAMEVNPDEADPMVMMNAMKMDSGKVLKDLYSEEEWADLSGYFKEKLRQDLAMYNSFKPFFIMSMTMQAQYGKEMSQAVDLHFHKMAKAQDKQVFGLETLEEQLSAIDGIKLDEQAEMLLEMLNEEGKKKDPSEELIKWYAKGDIQRMAEMADEMEYSSDFSEGLITDRNVKMADRMVPLIQKQSTFVAVGALHLPGEEGILTLLEEKGYTVKPILK